MNYNIDYQSGILYEGNTYRLSLLMKNAEAGGHFTIGFIGGSITQGSVASRMENCYAYRVYKWWVDNFKNSTFTFINAGIGATDSQFGVARVWDDLLKHNPDFVITEFSVNDENNLHFLETYEGLVRKIYSYATKPAMIVMNNAFYDDGRNAEDQHLAIAKHYAIPSLGIRPSICKAIADGVINAKDITPDNLHPNDEGHALVAKQITFYLDEVKRSFEKAVKEELADIAKPLTINTYEHSVRLNNINSTPTLAGFTKDLSKQEGPSDCFKKGWMASKTGDKIYFRVSGTNLSVQYKKCFKHPAPIAKLTLDEEKTFILDANFDETWGDKLYLETLGEHLEDCVHEITVEIVEAHPNDTSEFYLAAILASGNEYKKKNI